MSAPDIDYALILMGCWKRDAKPHGCAEACELAERSILYQQARIATLEAALRPVIEVHKDIISSMVACRIPGWQKIDDALIMATSALETQP